MPIEINSWRTEMKSSKLSGVIAIALGLCLIAGTGLIYGASADFYLTFKSGKLGEIKGESTSTLGIPGTQFHYEVTGPREAGSGMATGREANTGTPPKTSSAATTPPPAGGRDTSTGALVGKRRHALITITKETDMSSPKLAQAVTTGELLTVDFSFVHAGPDGKQEVYKTLHLTDVVITSIHRVGGNAAGDRPMESITLSFDPDTAVAMTKSGGKSAMDDWVAK
jgi:type VI secretion system secreted protein Hcp